MSWILYTNSYDNKVPSISNASSQIRNAIIKLENNMIFRLHKSSAKRLRKRLIYISVQLVLQTEAVPYRLIRKPLELLVSLHNETGNVIW